MRKNRNLIGWIFLAPSMILYLWLFIYPTIEAFRISFHKWTGFTAEKEFVGIKNYIQLFNDETFLFVLKNTFLVLFVGGAFIFSIAFIFSVMMSSGIKGKKFFRNAIFLPYIIAPIAHAIYWGLVVYSPMQGMLNNFFELINFEAGAKFVFLSSANMFWSVLFVIVWVYIGFYMIILMAAMERIPHHLYEAARLEGANEFQVFFKITVPLVKEVILIKLIFWAITATKLFGLLYAFGSSSGYISRREIWVNSVYTYVMAFGDAQNPTFRLGYASAVAVITLFIIVIIALITRKLIKREVYEY